MVPTGLFAQGGRQVRCARCRHEWRSEPPNNIDVVAPPSVPPVPAPPSPEKIAHGSTPNLPALIQKFNWKKTGGYVGSGIALLLLILLAWLLFDRQNVVKNHPDLRPLYDGMGLGIPHTGQGLVFDKVSSELRYDSGAMKLSVDGVIHNTTDDIQSIPDIKADARGADQAVIQSWWVDAPAATIPAGGEVPFHTEIGATTQHTIEDVYLEFTPREDKGQ